METINEQIRNKLSPIKNIVALINAYKDTLSGEERMKIVNQIIKSGKDLEYALNELTKIK